MDNLVVFYIDILIVSFQFRQRWDNTILYNQSIGELYKYQLNRK